MSNYKRSEKRKHHIIYKTTCQADGRWYIGLHSTDDLDDGYIGSGTELARSIRKYGRDAHKCEILEQHESRDAIRKREAELVTMYEVLDFECMNQMPGGGGGWEHQNSNSEVQREKIQRWNAKRELIELVNPGWWSRITTRAAATRKAQGWKPSIEHLQASLAGSKIGSLLWTGQCHNEATKEKLSASHLGAKNAMFGKIWISNLETKACKLVAKEYKLEYPWVIGRNAWNQIDKQKQQDAKALDESIAQTVRNAAIVARYSELGSLAKVAAEFKLSRKGIHRIIQLSCSSTS